MAWGHAHRLAAAPAERVDDLADLEDLLGGGENKRGEAFPGVLPQQAQAAAGGHCGLHRRILGEGSQHILKREFELKVIDQPAPIAHRFGYFRREG